MTPTLVVGPQNVKYIFHLLDGLSWIDGGSAFKSFVGNHVNTEETYKRGKESSSHVINVQYTSPTFIKSNLDKLQLQNEDEARKGNIERNANDISKFGEHNTLYQYQLCTPRSSTVTCVYRSHSILIRENPRNSPPCWRWWSLLAIFVEPCISINGLTTSVLA